MARRLNPSRRVLGPPEDATISEEDAVRARAAWRRDAPRRWWGLVDAPAAEPPPEEPPA